MTSETNDRLPEHFSEFSEENVNLTGKKVNIRELFGREILVKAYRVMPSKAVPGKQCVQLQVELDGDELVVFTTSMVLLRQVQQYQDHLPFLTVIRNMGRYHSFS